MQMTHLRFALDLKQKLDIHDLTRYLSGALYPDSRYFTKVPRTVTHNEGAPTDLFAKGWTDFEKGWATHLYYDRVAGTHIDPMLGGLPLATGEEGWFRATAIKAIEDSVSYDLLPDPLGLLQHLEASPPPRGEDPALLGAHYASLRVLYASKPTMQDYGERYEKIGMPQGFAERISLHLEDLLAGHRSEVESIYGKVLQSVWDSSSQR